MHSTSLLQLYESHQASGLLNSEPVCQAQTVLDANNIWHDSPLMLLCYQHNFSITGGTYMGGWACCQQGGGTGVRGIQGRFSEESRVYEAFDESLTTY